jgi:hypothetical protein
MPGVNLYETLPKIKLLRTEMKCHSAVHPVRLSTFAFTPTPVPPPPWLFGQVQITSRWNAEARSEIHLVLKPKH